MDLGLKGKVALVMGASTGLGRAVAASLVKEGARVAICARNEEKLKATAKEIGAEHAIPWDLSKAGSGAGLVGEVIAKLGRVDILVCNTGGPPKGQFHEITPEGWNAGFQGLWMSVVDSVQRALPGMQERKWGRILLVTSVAAKEPMAALTVSNGLRAGLLGLVKSLSHEIARDGVTVNALLPGYTDTERLRDLKVPADKIVSQIPAGRLCRPDEFGDLAAFVASDKAGYLTGQTIALDGGYLKGI